ncbi:MAG: NADH-quinone oxidoreductase subunit J [Bacteroidota bacterium]
MSGVQILFYAFGALTLGGGVFLLLTKNVLYAAYGLMATLLGMAALYVFLGADFVGATQIIVYVGGVLVLVLFGVMLTNRLSGQKILSTSHNRLAGYSLALILLAVFGFAIYSLNWSGVKATPTEGTVKPIGQALMTDYLLAFELIGVLLLIVLVGAAYVARLSGAKEKGRPTE